jgi:hypothetical protein
MSESDMIQPGERVGVFDSVEATGTIRFYGYGVYRGQRLMPNWRALAIEWMPLNRAAWRQVMSEDPDQLIDQALRLLQAEAAIMTEQGHGPSTRPATMQSAQEIVQAHRARLAQRLEWDDETTLAWMQENDQMLRSPYIELDDGRGVWGFATWWEPESDARRRIDDLTAQGYQLTQV